jgi:hypothetical protein
MEPKDPRTLSDEQLESRLRDEGLRRYDNDLFVRREDDGSWSAQFKSFKTPADMAPKGVTRHGIEGAPSGRVALEQLWLSLDIEDDLEDYRRERRPT